MKVFVYANNACTETPGLSIRTTTSQVPNNHSQHHQRNEVMVGCFVCWSALLCKTLYPVGSPLVQTDLKPYVLPLNGLTSLLTIVPIIGCEVSQCCGCLLCCSSWVGALHRDNLRHLPPWTEMSKKNDYEKFCLVQSSTIETHIDTQSGNLRNTPAPGRRLPKFKGKI